MLSSAYTLYQISSADFQVLIACINSFHAYNKKLFAAIPKPIDAPTLKLCPEKLPNVYEPSRCQLNTGRTLLFYSLRFQSTAADPYRTPEVKSFLTLAGTLRSTAEQFLGATQFHYPAFNCTSTFNLHCIIPVVKFKSTLAYSPWLKGTASDYQTVCVLVCLLVCVCMYVYMYGFVFI